MSNPAICRVTDRLELLQDEWGYPPLGHARHRLPRRAVARAHPARLRLAHHLQPQPRQVPHHRYFACLGAGYIMVEVGLIADFMLALSNATVSHRC